MKQARISDGFRKRRNLAVQRVSSIIGMMRLGRAEMCSRLNHHTDVIAVKYWPATFANQPRGAHEEEEKRCFSQNFNGLCARSL